MKTLKIKKKCTPFICHKDFDFASAFHPHLCQGEYIPIMPLDVYVLVAICATVSNLERLMIAFTQLIITSPPGTTGHSPCNEVIQG